ncbi:MAG: NrsF family protein [Proteobacteria bacterium]|nr:NrsF family protein [Pseudomonadota bacterium]
MKTDRLVHLLASDNDAATARARRAQNLNLVYLMLAAVLTAAGFVLFVGLRDDLAAVMPAILRKEAVTLAAVLAGGVVFWRLSAPEGRNPGLLMAPVVMIILFVLWELARTGLSDWQGRMIGTNSLSCLVLVSLLALPVLGALLALLKWRAPGASGRAGAAAGLVAAGFAASLYALHCTDDSMLFVALWYSIATLLLSGLGALAARHFVRW